MTDFPFMVDEAYARTHNEFLRDAKRLQISAGILAVILAGIIAAVFYFRGPDLASFAVAISLGFFALLSLIMIPVLPKKMGSPQEYYAAYKLAPAMVAEVNARDMVIMAYVDANADPEKAPRGAGEMVVPALAVRTVTSIPGIPREVGAQVPSMAVTGYRPTRGPKVYEEISPMPVAWGTPDEKVWKEAERAIPTNQWKKLERMLDRVQEAKKADRNVLFLEGRATRK